MSSLKFIIPIIIVFILIGAGAYSIFKTQTAVEVTDRTQNNFPSASPSPQVKSAVTPTNQPATGSEDELQIKNVGIQLTSPLPQSKISSPIIITGTANVTSQTIMATIKDTNGVLLGQGKAEACIGLDACKFSMSVPFKTVQNQAGSIEIYSPSTTDGSKTYLQVIPVSF